MQRPEWLRRQRPRWQRRCRGVPSPCRSARRSGRGPRARDVALNGRQMRTDGGYCGIKLGLPPASDVDVRAFFDELLCGGEADATANRP
jgi:hypothetical protein